MMIARPLSRIPSTAPSHVPTSAFSGSSSIQPVQKNSAIRIMQAKPRNRIIILHLFVNMKYFVQRLRYRQRKNHLQIGPADKNITSDPTNRSPSENCPVI